MPGPRKCEPGCRCGHHPDGMMTPEQYTEMRRTRERERARNRPYDAVAHRRNWLKFSHGISPEELAALWEAQRGLCCYCEQPLPPADSRQVHVDHNHACTCGPKRSCRYCRRGLACQNCNFVVGNAGDDPDRLERIAKNLRRLNTESNARLNGRPMQIELIVPGHHGTGLEGGTQSLGN